MKHKRKQTYPVDNASLLFLSLIRKNHTNTFRFTATMTEPVCPEMLQMAVDRVYRRFPTIIAGFYPGFFHYLQVPAKIPPQVQPDPGLLHTMSREEIRDCAYRVFFEGSKISIEAFHALTDGYGAIASFTTLVAEYLRLKHGVRIPAEKTLIDLETAFHREEITDAYESYETGKPLLVPSRFSYQIPGQPPSPYGIRTSRQAIPTKALLDAAHRCGVSMTTLLSTIMAQSIMEIQQQHVGSGRAKPVRIMVPIDLRRMFPSRTLRNFVLYALPTMEPQEQTAPSLELMRSFRTQIRSQAERSRLESIMAYNVRTQRAWYFRLFPWALKSLCLRIGYRFFGESNSSLTLTNLGNVQLPEAMQPFVEDLDVVMTPRARSPFGCSILSYRDHVVINISRFGQSLVLAETFFRRLHAVL